MWYFRSVSTYCFLSDNASAIPLKTRRGEENLRDPLVQKKFNPLAKNGYFPLPLRLKTGFFYPLQNVFSCDPQTVLSNFTPIRQFFPPILLPSDSFFSPISPLGQLFDPPRTAFLPILPHRTVYFDSFYSPRHFSENFSPLGHLFPSNKNLQVKKRIFSTPLGQGDLTPSDKKAISSPLPVFLMELP